MCNYFHNNYKYQVDYFDGKILILVCSLIFKICCGWLVKMASSGSPI